MAKKRCPNCDTIMVARYQNTGHVAPEGEPNEEIELYYCLVCGLTDEGEDDE